MILDQLVKKAIKSVKNKDNILGKGSDGIVYAVDETVVLKLYKGEKLGLFDTNRIFYYGSSKQTAEYEFNMGRELHQKGAQVPEYFDLFEPSPLPLLGYWGIFMERIYGVEYNALPLKLRPEAERQYEEQTRLEVIITLKYNIY